MPAGRHPDGRGLTRRTTQTRGSDSCAHDVRPVAQRYSGCGLAFTPDSPRGCRRAELLRGRGSRTDSGRRAADGRVRDPTRSRSAPPARRLPSPPPPPNQRIAAILNAAVECAAVSSERTSRRVDVRLAVSERIEARVGGPLTAACVRAAPPVEGGEERNVAAVACLKEEAFVGPAGAVVVGLCLRIN
jgi:hypothetical protein